MLSHAVKSLNRHQWISEAAYYKALARKFEPGKELTDWLEAEIDYYNMLIDLYISILEEDGEMTVLGLQQLAQFIGIQNPEDILLKTELVGAIQSAAGHTPCFRSKISMLCEEIKCKWRAECRKLIAVWFC
ncbi:DUF2934 domain-containing protein [Methylobacter sp.]|uniref:DUF2934 domain-containing protein n=1 Tax=Methylobacter sp. TaxID=2051955 RepID=UPI00121F765F|nr:DUF2934 domain-containing protein [Methylobacter sp.]TAK61827.1 MAG: DUF2934 domain-containing protein [Methylobacter sp.]